MFAEHVWQDRVGVCFGEMQVRGEAACRGWAGLGWARRELVFSRWQICPPTLPPTHPHAHTHL